MTLIALSMSAFSTLVIKSEGRTSWPLTLTETRVIGANRTRRHARYQSMGRRISYPSCEGNYAEGGTVLRREVVNPDHAQAKRVARELNTVAHADLLEDVSQVRLDRVLADEQLRADLGVTQPRCHVTHDLALARGERLVRWFPQLADQACLECGGHEHLAARHRANGIHQRLDGE